MQEITNNYITYLQLINISRDNVNELIHKGLIKHQSTTYCLFQNVPTSSKTLNFSNYVSSQVQKLKKIKESCTISPKRE